MIKKVGKTVGIVFAVLLTLIVAVYGYYKLCMDPYRGTVRNFEASMELDEKLSEKEAKEDLAYLMKRVRERHPAWLDDSGKDVLVEEQYEQEVATIKGEVSVLELYQMASRILAVLHDGHTYVNWYGNQEMRYIDNFAILRNYGRPLKIDGIPSEELLETFKNHFFYETDYYVEERFWEEIIRVEVGLQLCGVDTSDGVAMSFDVGCGEKEIFFDFVPLRKVRGYVVSAEDTQWVSYEIDKENSVGIFTLTSCVCNEEYYRVLDNFFEEVLREGIEHVVVDLRGNGGGNSLVANEFLTYIEVDEYLSLNSARRYGRYLLKNENVCYENQKQEQTFDGDLYVLTDVWTYSAAMDFAMLIADNDLGTIVGEPSGNLPDSYGDCLFFQMPNSKLAIGVSYKKWRRIDQTKAGEPIMPDIEVPSEDALQKVYEIIK